MDPNETLRELRALISRLMSRSDVGRGENDDEATFRADAERSAELIDALDGWLSAGGFLPDRWSRR